MKNFQIIALVAGSCIVTFIVSVVFAVNMVSITPENLVEVVKKNPVLFLEALQEAAKTAQSKRKEKQLEEQMKNPLKIETEGRVVFGEESAPVTIVEFSDFQCPYCAKAAKRMSELREKYDEKVKVVYKHYPLSFHAFAQPAAEYFEALALISHDKAREFHDKIFENFNRYARLESEEEISSAIDSLLKEIDVKKSDVEKNLEKAKKVVSADLEEADKLNVRGTPSFFVNGIDAKHLGIEELIEKFLK